MVFQDMATFNARAKISVILHRKVEFAASGACETLGNSPRCSSQSNCLASGNKLIRCCPGNASFMDLF